MANFVKELIVENGIIAQGFSALVDSESMTSTGIPAGNQGDSSHIPIFNVDTAGRIGSITNTPMTVIDQGGQAWNAFADKYGIKGDGVADDYVGLQKWINDGITSGKKLIMPPPPVTCLFSQPLLFNIANTYNEGLGQNSAGLCLECQPGFNTTGVGYALTYSGTSNQSALQFLGLQNAVIRGLTLNVGGAAPTASNVVAMDFQCTTTLPNFPNLHLEDVHILFQGTGTNRIGFRFGQSSGGAESNITGTYMVNCTVTDSGSQLGSIGCQIGGSEVVPFTAVSCEFSFLGAAWYIGAIQSETLTALVANQTTMPLQTSLLFPTSGSVYLAGTTLVSYTGKDNSTHSVTDGVTTSGNNVITSASNPFTNSDIGATVVASGIPVGTYIQSLNNFGSANLSQNATVNATGVSISWTRNLLTGCTGIPTESNPGLSVQQYVTGQGLYPGGADNTWLACSGGGNHWDYYFNTGNNFRIFGGRWEGQFASGGNRFLQTAAITSGFSYNVLIQGVTLAGYIAPTDYIGVFVLNAATTLRFVSSTITLASASYPLYGANLINAAGSWYYTSITVEDCRIGATTPFWTIANGIGTAVNLRNVQLTDVNGVPQSVYNMVHVPAVTLTDAVSGTVTVDASQGTYFILPMTGSSNRRTLAFVNGQPGQIFRILAEQSSSGSNSITWPTIDWAGGSQPSLSGATHSDEIEIRVTAVGTYLGSVVSNF